MDVGGTSSGGIDTDRGVRPRLILGDKLYYISRGGLRLRLK